MNKPETPRDHCASMLEAIDRYRELHSQTGNPLWYWMALLAAGNLREHETGYTPSEEPLTLPGWCANYFTEVAQDLTFLAYGTDKARRGVAGQDYPTLTTEAAMKLVTQALGFTRRGYSAFEQARSTLDLMQVFHRYEDIRAEGIPAVDAIARLIAEDGLEERSVRRRISTGRRYVKGMRPEEKTRKDKT